MFICGTDDHLTMPREPAARIPVRVRPKRYPIPGQLLYGYGYETVEERLFCPVHASAAEEAYRRMVAAARDVTRCSRHLHVVTQGVTGGLWRQCILAESHSGPCE